MVLNNMTWVTTCTVDTKKCRIGLARILERIWLGIKDWIRTG
jgi:hypothetical protein